MSVASDHRLVAEAVGAALVDSGVRATVAPWEVDAATEGGDRDLRGRAGLDVLICDLAPAKVNAACARGRSSGRRWIVITDAPRGAVWGAMLAGGARAVVDATVSIEELIDILLDVGSGLSPIGEVERRSLLRQWADLRQQQDRVQARMRMLTPREHEVLDLLYQGQTVRLIAAQLGVSESTVRSQVKAVLRKLAVPSQLAAVATVDELHAQVPHPRDGG